MFHKRKNDFRPTDTSLLLSWSIILLYFCYLVVSLLTCLLIFILEWNHKLKLALDLFLRHMFLFKMWHRAFISWDTLEICIGLFFNNFPQLLVYQTLNQWVTSKLDVSVWNQYHCTALIFPFLTMCYLELFPMGTAWLSPFCCQFWLHHYFPLQRMVHGPVKTSSLLLSEFRGKLGTLSIQLPVYLHSWLCLLQPQFHHQQGNCRS